MSSEAFSAGSHLFAAALGLDFEQLQELQNVDGQSGDSFMQVAYSTEQNIKELTKLRVDAVANAVGDQTVFDDAYEGSHPDIPVEEDNSKIMQAARAIADKGGFSAEKREAFLQYIQDNRGSMQSATIENGKIILMADGAKGGYNANTFRTNLPEGERGVRTGTFTYTEGGVKKTETVYIFNDCANPAVDATPDVVEPPKVVTPVEPPKVDTCPNPEWRATVETSQDGIRIGDEVFHKIPVIHAPSGYTLDQAVDGIVRSYESGAVKAPEKGCATYLLFVDENCDGHPEKVQCVRVWKEDGQTRVDVNPLSAQVSPGSSKEMPYDDMTEEQQRKWMKR